MAKGSHSSFCTWLQTASWLWSESIHFCLLVVFSPYKSDLIKTEMWSYASVFQTLNWWNSTKMLNCFNIGWNKLKFLSPIPIIRNAVRLWDTSIRCQELNKEFHLTNPVQVRALICMGKDHFGCPMLYEQLKAGKWSIVPAVSYLYIKWKCAHGLRLFHNTDYLTHRLHCSHWFLFLLYILLFSWMRSALTFRLHKHWASNEYEHLLGRT